MSKIIFPGLNLEFAVSPIAFKIGVLQVYWYGFFIVLGIALSLILLYFSKNKYNIKDEDLLEIAIFVLIFGIIGARVFYVVFNLDYYLENTDQILNIRNGGLAIFGGIIVGAITTYIFCQKKKIDFYNFCDYVVPYLALSQGIGRIGNFFNVEAYGIETISLFRMGIESRFGYIEVHPCFLYEMIGCLIIFLFLKYLQKRQNFEGQILSSYLILYGILRFFVESLRADSLMIYELKISQIISVIILILGIFTYIKYIICRMKSNKVNQK